MRRAYYGEAFSKQYSRGAQAFFRYVLSTFIPSLVLHTFFCGVIGLFPIFPQEIDFQLIGQLLTNSNERDIFVELQEDFWNIVIYNIVVCTVGYFAGLWTRWFVTSPNRKLDRRYKLFRFENHWHYIISGAIADFPRSRLNWVDSVEDIEVVYVDALVETKEGTIIYDGFLVDYELKSDNSLDLIALTNVERRYLTQDYSQNTTDSPSQRTSYYKVKGHLMVIPYDQIINLNFTYYKLNVAPDEYGELKYTLEQIR